MVKNSKFFILLICMLIIFMHGNIFSQNVSLSGSITSCSNQQAVTGAKLVFKPAAGGTSFTAMSVDGGAYSLTLPAGTYDPVTISKTGFDTIFQAQVNIPPNPAFTLNYCLNETANPVPSLSCQFDTASSSVHCSWPPSQGPYELLYDDGLQDVFTIWASGGNKNAMKFTPLAWPVKVSGGKVHIGMQSDYPAQYNHAVFVMAVYDASGPSSQPGNQLAVVAVTPSAFEWIEFQFQSPVTITSGDFYLVMQQEGSYPNATGLAVDLSNPQYRSWSKNGAQSWVPAEGNFMIRATMNGPGGPSLLEQTSPASVQNYQLYRLRQGEEQNPLIWTPVALTSNLSYTDNSWPSLPCGPYRWAVKAVFPSYHMSAPMFSNAIGKCWTAPVIMNISLSCAPHDILGTRVKLVNQVYPDTLYSAILDTNHRVSFPHVWKGSYYAHVNHFGYTGFSASINIMTADTITTFLQQVKSPPSELTVNSKTLNAAWKMPAFKDTLFSENWSSGSFATHGWTTSPIYTNWKISSANGNPAPSAFFDFNPQLVNYDQSLQTPLIANPGASMTLLGFDVYLDNYSTTTQNRLAVEIWNGSAWNTVKVFSNQGGSIPWTTELLDISDSLNSDFRIRFRAAGENSFDISGWNVDNIYVLATESPQQIGQCITGYYFLLGSMISGFAVNNQYSIPGAQVQYGQTYSACVEAIYSSGVSAQACTTFESTFLWPVRNFQGDTIQNAAYLHWEKPEMTSQPGGGTPPGLLGYSVYRDSVLIAFVTADTLYYYDLSLPPGNYSYQVSARYDLAPYGFPGTSDESYRMGPVDLYISFGRLIPFFETWNQGSFSFNSWSFQPTQGNWIIDPANGQPPPSAAFTWDPPLANYFSALQSGDLDPAAYHCAGIWVDFMLRLDDQAANAAETLSVEVYYNNVWHPKLEISNRGSFDWSFYHINISEVRQKGFRIRFAAKGSSSSNILRWMLDNINVYGICYAPVDLSADAAALDVILSWSKPQCTNGGMILDEGFEETDFPPPDWTRRVTDVNSSWKHGSNQTPQGVHSGLWAALLDWDYGHQDEWLIAHNIYVSGNLTFWSYAYQGSSHGDHYYVLVSLDQGVSWTTLLDLSALPVYPSATGYNAWLQPYVIDMAAFRGNNVDIAWRAVDGDSLGLWYSWAIDDCSIGYTPVNLSGYDVYRKSPDSAAYIKINRTSLQDTVFIDTNLFPGQYTYYVVALLGECTIGTSSDTVLVDVVTGIKTGQKPGVKIYPNPTNEKVTIVSPTKCEKAELFDQMGTVVRRFEALETTNATISLKGLSAGVYYLKIKFENDTGTFMILKTE